MENASAVITVPSESGPRPFGEIPALWLKLPHMDQTFFAAEMSHVSALNTFLGVATYAIVAAAAIALVVLLDVLVRGTQDSSAPAIAITLGGCYALIITPVSFYLNTGINYISAKAFGGKGKFNDQAYLASLFIVPTGFISSFMSLIGLVPVVGTLIEIAALLVIVIMVTVLQYRVVRVVHSLSSDRAIGAVLAPFGLVLCLVCLSVGLILALASSGDAIGNIFSSTNQSLLTPGP